MITGQTVNTFVALLRGVNVSGKNKLFMGDLQTCLQKLGFAEVNTYLQSGNVVFDTVERDTEKLSATLMQRIKVDLGLDVVVLVISAKELYVMIASNTLIPLSGGDEKLFHATFLAEPVSSVKFEELELPSVAEERAILQGRAVLLHCPHGYGKTRLNNSYFERKLGVAATTRNWRTVLALQALCKE